MGGLTEKVSEWDGSDGDWKVAEIRKGRLDVDD